LIVLDFLHTLFFYIVLLAGFHSRDWSLEFSDGSLLDVLGSSHVDSHWSALAGIFRCTINSPVYVLMGFFSLRSKNPQFLYVKKLKQLKKFL